MSGDEGGELVLSSTSDEEAPRVLLPGMMAHRPLTPGPNSWAQDQALDLERGEVLGADEGLSIDQQPTNRQRYEDKPLPNPATESARKFIIPPKEYIQPAIPLVNTPQTRHKKNRSVTEPAQSTSQSAAKKPSVSQLARKFSSQKAEQQLPALPPNISEKALSLLGVQRKEPSVSTPAEAKTPERSHKSLDESPATVKGPARHIQSTPLPSRPSSADHHDRSLDLGSPKIVAPRVAPKEPFQEQLDTINSELIEQSRSTEHLQPPKIPMYGNAGKPIVHQHAIRPSESFRGVIETASIASRDSHRHVSTETEEDGSGNTANQRQPSGELLQPTVYSPSAYSPSNYGGVWENDPAVGSTLPPFTPGLRSERFNAVTNQPSPLSGRDAVSHGHKFHTERRSEGRHRFPHQAGPTHGGPEPQYAYQSHYSMHGSQQTLPSANSWASRSQQGSYASSSATPVSAVLPPQWPAHVGSGFANNYVPSPPHTHPDYQRSSALSAGLAQLDMTLHHHIDSVFGSLSRQITEKHDRVIDQLISRVDRVDEAVSKGLRHVKDDIRAVRKDVSTIKVRLSEEGKSSPAMMQLLEELGNKIQELDRKVTDQQRSQASLSTTQHSGSGSGSEADMERHYRAQAPLDGHPGQASRGFFGRASSKARQSGTSSQGHRSRRSTTSTSQTGDRHSNTSNERAFVRPPFPGDAVVANGNNGGEMSQRPAYGMMQAEGSQTHAANQRALYTSMHSENEGGQRLQHQQRIGGGGGGGGWYEQAYGQGP